MRLFDLIIDSLPILALISPSVTQAVELTTQAPTIAEAAVAQEIVESSYFRIATFDSLIGDTGFEMRYVWYMSPSEIELIDDDTRRAKTIEVFVSEQDGLLARNIIRTEIDCKARRFRWLRTGEDVGSPAVWTDAAPHSIGETMLRFACGSSEDWWRGEEEERWSWVFPADPAGDARWILCEQDESQLQRRQARRGFRRLCGWD